MTPRQSCDDVFLTGEDAAFIRQALCACSGVLAWIRQNGGPLGAAVLAQAARDGTAIGHAEYDANLAIDYLDFPTQGRAGPVTGPAAPPLPAELDALVRRMRLPYLRKAAPDVLATARAQRWEPAEVLRVLLAEEVTGRDAATRRMRRKTAAFPSGKTFSSWRGRGILHPRRHPGRPGHPGMDRTGGEPGHRRPVRDRQVASRRGPGPRRDRERPARRLVHPGDPHRRDRESQSRRVGRPHRHPDLPQRPHRGR